MGKYSEINHILNSNQHNIKYIRANSSIDYIFYEYKDIIFTDNNSLPFNKIIAHNLNDYNNIECSGLVKKILFMHSPPDFTKKKEDIFIIKEQIKKSNIELMFFEEYTMAMWGEKNSRIIPYTVPVNKILQIIKDHNIPIQNAEKNKNAIVLNFNKNENIHKLYHKIKQDGIDCDHIDTLPNSMVSFIDKIMRYKIIINVESINIHNSLFSILCGCWTICPNLQDNIINLESLLKVSSFSDIGKILQNSEKLDSKVLDKDRDIITDKYNNESPIEVL